ncbi:hypothetical protein COCVIDRAFT_89255, partial [Bipolaris victoriae FI3]
PHLPPTTVGNAALGLLYHIRATRARGATPGPSAPLLPAPCTLLPAPCSSCCCCSCCYCCCSHCAVAPAFPATARPQAPMHGTEMSLVKINPGARSTRPSLPQSKNCPMPTPTRLLCHLFGREICFLHSFPSTTPHFAARLCIRSFAFVCFSASHTP